MIKVRIKYQFCFLFALTLFAFTACSELKVDPVKPSSGMTDSSMTEAAVPTKTALPEADTPTQGFYSMSMEDSYDQYGIFTFLAFSIDNWYDHEKYFAIRYVSEEGEPSMYAPMTLKYRDYPDGKTWSPVCKDPLCTHTGASGCPLAKCQNLKLLQTVRIESICLLIVILLI